MELIWDGAQLACSTAAPLTARGDLHLTLPEGGSGTISDLRRGGDADGEDAAIVAGGEVAVSGEGTLTVTGQAGTACARRR